jgi:hypothetical protein
MVLCLVVPSLSRAASSPVTFSGRPPDNLAAQFFNETRRPTAIPSRDRRVRNCRHGESRGIEKIREKEEEEEEEEEEAGGEL